MFAVAKVSLLKGDRPNSEHFTPDNNTQYTVFQYGSIPCLRLNLCYILGITRTDELIRVCSGCPAIFLFDTLSLNILPI